MYTKTSGSKKYSTQIYGNIKIHFVPDIIPMKFNKIKDMLEAAEKIQITIQIKHEAYTKVLILIHAKIARIVLCG